MRSAAENQLRLGLQVIVDAVSSLEVARDMWRRAASHARLPLRVIEIICSDPEVHRRRLAARVRNIDGFPAPTWDEVIARRDEWEEWQDDRLVLDSTEPLADNADRALTFVQH